MHATLDTYAKLMSCNTLFTYVFSPQVHFFSRNILKTRILEIISEFYLFICYLGAPTQGLSLWINPHSFDSLRINKLYIVHFT